MIVNGVFFGPATAQRNSAQRPFKIQEATRDALLRALFSLLDADLREHLAALVRGYLTGSGRPNILNGLARTESTFAALDAPELSRSAGVFFKGKYSEAPMVTPDQIKEHMEVVGNDGLHVGVIDRVEAGEIRLTRNDSPDGLHHFLPLANVEYVDDRVHLNRSSIRAMAEWR